MQAFLTDNKARKPNFRVIKGLWTLVGDRLVWSSRVLSRLTDGTVPARDELSGVMALSQAGDKQAYRRVLTACVPVAAAAARCAGVHDAAVPDVVRDMLLTVHRAMPTYDPSRPVGPWLQAIARHCAMDALRSREQSFAPNAALRFGSSSKQKIVEAERHSRWLPGRRRNDHPGRRDLASDAAPAGTPAIASRSRMTTLP